MVLTGQGGSHYYEESTADTSYQGGGWTNTSSAEAHAWGDDTTNWSDQGAGVIQKGGTQGTYLSH